MYLLEVAAVSANASVLKYSNTFFGGMAAPEWNSEGKYIEDPASECSWLFPKLVAPQNKYF